MGTHNHNEAITLPSVGLPVLLRASAQEGDGRVVGYKIERGIHPVEVPVRIVPGDVLKELVRANLIRDADKREQALKRFATKYGPIAEPWQGVLRAVLSARHRMVEGRRKEARKIIEDHLQDRAEFKQVARRNPADWLVRMLSDGLRRPNSGVEFVIWWNDKARLLAAGLLCPDARTAAYALLLRGVGQPGGFGVCERCGNPFSAIRAGQRYCSHSCQTAAAMVRYRSKKAHAAQGKGAQREGQSEG